MAARWIGVVWRRSCSGSAATGQATEAIRKPAIWERLKNGKMAVWTKSLLHDYAAACKDIAVGAKERPGKAAFYLSLLAGAGVCSSKAPTEDSFQSCLLEASSSLLLLSPWTRSRRSDQHVQNLMDLRNQGRVLHLDLFLFSIVYEAPYDPNCDLYPAHCPHLQPRWSHFPSWVLDIGFFGRWWLLRTKMEDFDVNEEEFAVLPAHMRNISWNDLHSQENEKLFQCKFQPITVPEEQTE
ncbi:mitochondrial import inner membrane translocase subunit Tim29 [Xenopus laevis]|uniref:Mitochondrial import inner membrane translocase subunit Tim29 n=2 Tax=Xenopus laevis TaxID=8355 RepID=A0AA97PYT9_XENLA|nr:mitochondrial import inner membrane translocase subunit Tim29 [Xenopus laevis]OCT56745.1 hypothetical protein XELAEV_18004430mg [Xenopus laevis]